MSVYPTKPHYTVYYTVLIYASKSFKYIDIPAATISSKVEVARSNRAGQAKHLTGREMILKPPPGGLNLVINHY
jgi:hypothetical protein